MMLASKDYVPRIGIEFCFWWTLLTTLAIVGTMCLVISRSFIELVENISSYVGVSTPAVLGFTLGTGLGVLQFFIFDRYVYYAFWWIFAASSAGVAGGFLLTREINLFSIIFILQAIVLGFFVGVRPEEISSYKILQATFRFLFSSIAIIGIVLSVYLVYELYLIPDFPDAHWAAFAIVGISFPVSLISGAISALFFTLSVRG